MLTRHVRDSISRRTASASLTRWLAPPADEHGAAEGGTAAAVGTDACTACTAECAAGPAVVRQRVPRDSFIAGYGAGETRIGRC